MQKNDSYIISIPSDVAYVSFAIEQIMRFLEEHYILNEDLFFEVRVILNELIINAIIHGNKEDSIKNVFVKVGMCSTERVYIIVEDQGEGMDKEYDCCSDKDEELSELSLMAETGRGLKIVTSLCQSFKINQKGNKIIIVKELK